MKIVPSIAAFAVAVLVGRVTDRTTGQPLPNVTVTVGSHRATTDAQGKYRLSGLSPGHYTVTAMSEDVPLQHRSVEVKKNDPQTIVNLVLCSTTLDYGCGGAGPGPG